MRSPEGKKENCMISKEDIVKEKMIEKILRKINCFEFAKSVSYKCQPYY